MPSARVLVVEDDATIGQALTGALRTQGYDVEWAQTGAEGIAGASDFEPELILLDLNLPDLDGVEVCRRVRAVHPAVRIVMLTARHDEVDVVVGLDAGANDYVTKPFRLGELLARVRAHLRQVGAPEADDQIEVGDVQIDVAARRVLLAGEEIDLRAKEFDLLQFLMTHAGAALSRERIMSEVWDEHWFGSTKTLDMHVSSLRKKLGEASAADGPPSRITTLRGVGYRFELP